MPTRARSTTPADRTCGADMPMGGQFHAPDDWTGARAAGGAARAVRRGRVGADRGAAPAVRRSTHGWTFHGSPPNERADRERRSIISHMMTTKTRWHPTNVHEIYSHYRRPDELEIDEAFFPMMWREDGYRTPVHRPDQRAGGRLRWRPLRSSSGWSRMRPHRPGSPSGSASPGVEHVYYQFVTLNGRVMAKVVPARHLRAQPGAGRAVPRLGGRRPGHQPPRHADRERARSARSSWPCPTRRPSPCCRGTPTFGRFFCNLYTRADRRGGAGRAAADLRPRQPGARPRARSASAPASSCGRARSRR